MLARVRSHRGCASEMAQLLGTVRPVLQRRTLSSCDPAAACLGICPEELTTCIQTKPAQGVCSRGALGRWPGAEPAARPDHGTSFSAKKK